MAQMDVCKVPPAPGVPLPFLNVALPACAQRTESSVLIRSKPTVTEISVIPISTGDEAGSLGGVKSGVIMGVCKFLDGSSAVFANGKRVVMKTSPTGQNGDNYNCTGAQLVPSQGKVFAKR